MIEDILPTAVAAAEAFGDPPEAELLPEEQAALGEVGEPRRREFTTVRHCARRALGALGLPPVPLVPGHRGAPQWPDGIVGSMTHCAGYRAAAVGRSPGVRTVGIDAEPHAPLPEGVLGAVSLPEERSSLALLAHEDPAVHWDRLLFCTKEAVYKAWYPVTHRWLGFHEATVDLRPDGSFHARVLAPEQPGPPCTPTFFEGRWLARNGLLLACIATLPHV
ncbi:4'-phosphopantetheinyl transferase superfamily protein [Streptomyces sp. ET3-23]|uniref:4'-phosphopantetheinyl transferase family protein n=1 Tax=Streptomyces sp. ET3-23 TaxID=2885643 RepID=UPI001D123DA7|nr:4'-phosphopantetheinyl transferase superfamily protein [Streptomyces sp. ET3-23]MCC2274647.1 4'-phosphopantetheinyl transferase superfamily protein [Streptomyces sp. ET3-23]